MHGPGSSTVPGYLTVVDAVCPGAVDVSAEGNIDWIFPSNTPDPNVIEPVDHLHQKLTGDGQLWDNMRAVGGGNAVTVSAFAFGVAISSTATDDAAESNLAAVDLSWYVANYASKTDYGVRWVVPAYKTRRYLRLYLNVTNCAAVITAHLSDGSAADAHVHMDAGGVAGLNKKITITFNSSTDNVPLIVTAICTGVYDPATNIAMHCATLATV